MTVSCTLPLPSRYSIERSLRESVAGGQLTVAGGQLAVAGVQLAVAGVQLTVAGGQLNSKKIPRFLK